MIVHTVPHPLSCLVLSKALKLREDLRKGWLKRGVTEEDCEDGLQHSLRLRGTSIRVPKRESGLSKFTIGLIAMLHDFDEISPGEDQVQEGGITFPFVADPRQSGFDNEQTLGEKIASAVKWVAFQRTVLDWPSNYQREATQIYDQYRGAYTPEAMVVHQCHPLVNLEMGLDYIAGVTRSGSRYREIDLTSFWGDAYEAQSWRGAPVDLGPELDRIHEREQVLRAV